MTDAGDFLAEIGAGPIRRSGKKNKTEQARQTDFGLKAKVTAYLAENVVFLLSLVFVTGLLGAAVLNIVFWQSGPHPAPIVSLREEAERVDETTTFTLPEPRQRQILVGADGTKNIDPLVRQIQRLLSERGYYPGEVDGLIGSRTRQAIGRYQATFAQTIDNTPSLALLEHIRLSSADPTFHERARARIEKAATQSTHVKTGKPAVVSNTIDLEHRDVLLRVQKGLVDLKIADMPVDGLMGPNTRSAIAEFQARQGLKVTGNVTEETLGELSRLNVY